MHAGECAKHAKWKQTSEKSRIDRKEYEIERVRNQDELSENSQRVTNTANSRERQRLSVQMVGTCSGGNTGGRLVQGMSAKCVGLR